MAFDLNKIPALEDEAPVVEAAVVQDVGTERDSNGSPGYRAGAQEPMIGPWQTLTPSELASLYNMVQVPANYHRVHHVITRRANGTAEHAWISWLPAHHASPGGVSNTAEWRTMPSIFATPDPLAAIRRAPGRRAAADGTSAFFDPGRSVGLWSNGGSGALEANRACPVTTEMEYHGDSEQSDSYGGGFESVYDRRNMNSKMEGRSTVRLVEVESNSTDGTKQGVPITVGVSTPLPRVQSRQDSDAASQEGAENDEVENGAELLDHLAREERRKMRELAFDAAFQYSTQRCSPTAPCRSCLEFCQAPVPVGLAESGSLGALYVDDGRPPVLKNMDEQEAAQKKGARHGPKSKSSEYRGVTFYKRTGRWEAHIWHEAAQVYLGASATKEEAAKAYDKAALMLGGPDVDINFEPESYQNEMSYLYKLSKEQLVIYLRRDSRGFGAQAAYPGVKHVKNHYQAIYGAILLGTFPTEEEAARVVYKAAVQDSFGTVASLIIDTHHVRNMPSFVAQRYAAVYPEEVEAMILKNQIKSSASRKGGKSSSSTKKCSSRSTKQKPSSSSPTPSATASPDPVEKRPAIQINESNPPAAKRNRSTWGQHLASRRAHKQTWPATKVAAPATVVPSSSSRRAFNTTPAVGVSISPSASVISAFSGTGQTASAQKIPSAPSRSVSSPWKKCPMTDTSTPTSSIKFKLFNVEIDVAEGEAAPGHDGHGNVPPRAQNLNGGGDDLYTPPLVTEENQFDKLALPRKRCKITGEWSPYLPYALATQMTSGLNNVVAINNRLHEILAETAPPRYATRAQGPRTGLALELPEIRNTRFPNRYNKYRMPNCACHPQFHE